MNGNDYTLSEILKNERWSNYTREDIKGLEYLPKKWWFWIPVIGPILLSRWLKKHVRENNIHFLKKSLQQVDRQTEPSKNLQMSSFILP